MKRVLILFLTLILIGCETNRDDDLMRHPNLLEKELDRCKLNQTSSNYCHHIKDLAHDLIILSNERAFDPEKFGKEIIQTEIELAQLQQTLFVTKNRYQQNKTPENQTELLAQQKTYNETAAKLQKLLNVVAATSSPE